MSEQDEATRSELEFAVREYSVATQHLLATMEKVERVPERILVEVIALCDAINEAWDEEVSS